MEGRVIDGIYLGGYTVRGSDELFDHTEETLEVLNEALQKFRTLDDSEEFDNLFLMDCGSWGIESFDGESYRSHGYRSELLDNLVVVGV